MNATQGYASQEQPIHVNTPGDQPEQNQMGGGELKCLPSECPVLKEAQAVSNSAQELARRAHSLRRSLKLCASCSLVESCGLIGELHWQIQMAIREVAREMGVA